MSQTGYVRAARREQIPPGGSAVVRIGRYDVAIFDVDGELHAYENACPHQGGPISEGWIENATVTCPWHAWCFDLRTGYLTLGTFARLRPFGLTVEDGIVFISSEPVEGA